MTWVLKFTYSDKTEETIYHFGNMFVRNANGQWFKMRYDEAEKLDGILANIEIFPLTSSDDKVDRFLELLGEVPYTGYDNDRFYNVAPSELSEKYGFDIFKLDQSCSSYLMYEDKIYSLGSSFGGYGTTSFAVADINKDGLKELYFTYSWGSGIHRSQIGYFDPATKEVICFNYSNTNNDMTFYVDAGTLVVCNAEVRADSFVDIDTICLTKVGELRFEEDQIKFVASEQAASQTYEGNGNLTTETDGMDTDRMITIAQDYVISNLMGYDGEVIDIENPTIEIIDELPRYYHHISDISDKEGGYYKVTFTTNLDDLLGPIGVYMDNAGNVIGSDYRE